MKVLLTGAAGFIGMHTGLRLLRDGHDVVGFDNMNDYYDVRLKEARVEQLAAYQAFSFVRGDLADEGAVRRVFGETMPDVVVHLGAQAGVRYSVTHPMQYGTSNLLGFLNVLEGCRRCRTGHLVFASSSSVYGANRRQPYSEHEGTDHPLSLYAATKKSNELMAHSYAHLYGLPVTGLRFFTVYGPWGRPDMAYFLFTKAIVEQRPIDIFHGGDLQRDFTYVDDVAEGVVRAAQRTATPDSEWTALAPDPATSSAPYRIYNVGNSHPVTVNQLVIALETALGATAVRRDQPMQPGDVLSTWARAEDLMRDVGFSPSTPIEIGVRRFVDWYRDYYRV